MSNEHETRPNKRDFVQQKMRFDELTISIARQCGAKIA
jgi:hypothetical protein